MHAKPVAVGNRLGVHPFAAIAFVQGGFQFKSYIILENPQTAPRVDAKSTMQLLMMAAGQGSELIFRIDGEDAEPAMLTLTDLFADGFGEPWA
jgi:Phosphotransferase System HPr (HPr) Family